VVIETDYIGSCKYSYRAFTTTTAPSAVGQESAMNCTIAALGAVGVVNAR
jgi:hypothetical protein